MDEKKRQGDRGDLTEGVIWKKLLGFFFPILFGMLFQQLYNTADAIIVGKFVGTDALAAVGGSPAVIINLVIGFFTGLSSGASVIISQCYGAHDYERLQRTTHTIVTFCLIVGAVVTLLSYFLAEGSLRLVRTPADIMDLSVEYLRVYFYGTIPLLLFNIGSGILRAVGDSKRPLYFLIACCLTNIALDLVFVLVLKMGAVGAAWATVIAQLISAVLVLVSMVRTRGPEKLHLHKLGINMPALRTTLYIGISAGVQSAMYSLSNIIIQAAVNDLGTSIVAAWTATTKIDGIYWVTSNSFGIAICAFVGQCFGAGKFERMKKSVNTCMLMATGNAVLISTLLVVFAKPLLSLVSNDNLVIDQAAKIMSYFVPYYVVWAFIEIISSTLRGVGDAVRPMIIIILGVCVLRALWVAFIVPLDNTIACISYSYPVSWGVTAVALVIYYFKTDWLGRMNKKTA